MDGRFSSILSLYKLHFDNFLLNEDDDEKARKNSRIKIRVVENGLKVLHILQAKSNNMSNPNLQNTLPAFSTHIKYLCSHWLMCYKTTCL